MARRTPAHRPSRCSRRRPSGASAGFPTTGPGYMSSTARPDRDKASAAADAAAVADALGVGGFAALGHSGGGPYALACGALLPGRVLAVAEGFRPGGRRRVRALLARRLAGGRSGGDA